MKRTLILKVERETAGGGGRSFLVVSRPMAASSGSLSLTNKKLQSLFSAFCPASSQEHLSKYKNETGGLSVFCGGTTYTWMEPLMARMGELYSLSPEESSWMLSSIEYGEVIFTVPAGFLADKYGRKLVLLSCGPLVLVGWLVVLASRSLMALYVTRVLHGASLAVMFGVVPLYIAEVAEPRVRGALAGQFQTMWAAGLLFTYLVGPYTSFYIYLIACAFLPLLFSVVFAFMPETPYFLLMKGRETAASASLTWLRGGDNVKEELLHIKNAVDADMRNKGSWRDLFSTAKDRKIFFTVQILCFIKYMIGSPCMSSYAAHTFAASSAGVLGEHEATIIYGSVLLISAFLGSLMSDGIGRRLLLVGTLFAIGVCYSCTALYFYLGEVEGVETGSFTWTMYLSVGLAAVLSNVGPSSLLQTVQGELFPSNTRAMGGALTGITASVASFLDLKQYQTLLDLAGLYANFVVFASFGFLGSILIFRLFKETAGKSLGQIQTDLKSIDDQDA